MNASMRANCCAAAGRSREKAEASGGSQAIYAAAEREVIKAIWLSAEQPCGKRLKAALPLWLPFYQKRHGQMERKVKAKVLAASAATIDRLLSPCRISLGSRGRCGTRPGTLLRSQIPIRTEHWEVSGPGFIEADTVAHCGGSMAGEFCWSITATDVHTQWTETRAVPNRGETAVAERIAQIEAALPFAILGFDTDNGGEFLNWHLVTYFGKRNKPVGFTRSRAYRKNDNARVEQKNWTHVRQLIGYGRLEGERWPSCWTISIAGMELFSQFLLSGDETPAHRKQRQPQTAHLRSAGHTLCPPESLLPSRPSPNRASRTSHGQARSVCLEGKDRAKIARDFASSSPPFTAQRCVESARPRGPKQNGGSAVQLLG